MATPLPAISPPPAPPAPEHTPAPALLRALAHVGEVDLATGLGRQRLAEVIRGTGPIAPAAWTTRRRWQTAAWLVLAAAAAALLILG